jgi:hypothetical protein
MRSTHVHRYLALLALAAGLAPARAGAGCPEDIQRLCANVPPGAGRIFVCLQTNRNNLSDSCRETLDEAQRMAADVGMSCNGDVFAWCQGVPRGQGRIFACLASHAKDLSSGCQDALATLQQFQAACGGDVAAVCGGLPAGGGRILACLLAQKDYLSPQCAAVLRSR